ncbi:MAG: deoxyribonuclease V [Chloroflexi bacterium]|nr:deoxyribonuclease V [Chloroflexota bacterium]
MRIRQLHGWRVSPAEARLIQRELASQVSTGNEIAEVHLVAGVDLAAGNRSGAARGAVVVLQYPELAPVETSVVERELEFPYVPGLLSFRETPVIIEACERLSAQPDLFLVDGQGYAHPRRFGFACHLGLLLDVPTVGCAKSILVGQHEELGKEAGSRANLIDRGEVVGAAVRTRAGVRPVYVSIGHRVDLEAAMDWVLRCCRSYRLPEPLRLAHQAAGGHLAEPAVRPVRQVRPV